MNRGAWQAAVQNWTRPKQLSMHTCVHTRARAHRHARARVVGGGGGEAVRTGDHLDSGLLLFLPLCAYYCSSLHLFLMLHCQLETEIPACTKD